ncbi:VOC family protein [Rhizobium halophytocola]|uniref:Lactoylglutathione lyase n=1 Tax=Rhizobium halophytocola TaxID=735519 RepID=A0ABS4DVS0_9HYPH|nr:VOC family protein [Rhizobium halophytocola]MBP1849783.1 putative lactoylglutathione lyase [Rhizobium halophytocola]
MSKMIFVNLPVRDLAAAEAFYTALGGTVNPQFSNETSKCMVLSETIYVMILTHARYRDFTSRPIGDAKANSHALIALSAESRDLVDETVARAVAAGGTADPNPVQDHGFMYGRSLEDPDGNVWELFWMDQAKVDG